MSEQPYRPQLPLRRRSKPAVVVGAFAAVVIAFVLVYVVVRVASQNPEQANLGERVFRFQAASLAEEIDERGPFLLQDPLGRGRDIYIHHLGDDVDEGWVAVRAYAGEADADCLLRWEPDDQVFVDPCTAATFPATGEGLVRFPTSVEGRAVEVDLRAGG